MASRKCCSLRKLKPNDFYHHPIFYTYSESMWTRIKAKVNPLDGSWPRPVMHFGTYLTDKQTKKEQNLEIIGSVFYMSACYVVRYQDHSRRLKSQILFFKVVFFRRNMKGWGGWSQFNDLSVKFTGRKADKCQRGGCGSDRERADNIKAARGGR